MLTGASEFPNLHEAQVAVLDAKPVALAPYGEAKIKFDALPPMRLAAPFEALRDKSDAILKNDRRAAKGLSRQSRHAGGLHRARGVCQKFLRDRRHRGHRYRGICRSGGAGRRFKASGAALACLCSSDKVYAAHAAGAAKALQDAGARHIYLAGRPGEQEAAFRAAGVNDFIFAGGDALATLQEAYRLTEGA